MISYRTNIDTPPAFVPPPPEPEVETIPVIPHEPDRLTVRRIQEAVAEFYKLSPEDMISGARKTWISHPRQVAMYLAREMTGYSFPNLGRQFGNRDHATIMQGIRAVDERLESNPKLRSQIDELREALEA